MEGRGQQRARDAIGRGRCPFGDSVAASVIRQNTM
jgi:hypothetical protein